MTSTVKVTSHNNPVRVEIRHSGRVMQVATLKPEDGERTYHCTTTREIRLIDQVLKDSTAPMTDGEHRVGVSFNPSASPEVDDFKRRVAALIDDLNVIASNRAHPGARCASIAMTELESAAMWAVKSAYFAVTKRPK